MKNITLRLDEDVIEELGDEADEHGVTRSEHIRNIIATRYEHEELRDEYEARIAELKQGHEREIDRLKQEYQQKVADLQEENERLRAARDDLQRQLRATNHRVDEHQKLVEYIEEQREIERYRGRREQMLDQAGLLTRWKWKFTGVPVDEPESEIGKGGHN